MRERVWVRGRLDWRAADGKKRKEKILWWRVLVSCSILLSGVVKVLKRKLKIWAEIKSLHSAPVWTHLRFHFRNALEFWILKIETNKGPGRHGSRNKGQSSQANSVIKRVKMSQSELMLVEFYNVQMMKNNHHHLFICPTLMCFFTKKNA